MKTLLVPRLAVSFALAQILVFSAAAAAPATPQGVIGAKIYTGIGGTAIADLTANARFPDSPDISRFEPYFELWATGDINTAAAADVLNNYGAHMAGYFYPETTGLYTFYISADDNAELYLSTDDTATNKKLIAIEPQWNNPREYSTPGSNATGRDLDAPQNSSATFTGTQWPSGNTITLTAGRAYYIEAFVKEGGGGDNLSVSLDAIQPIPGSRLSSLITDTTGPTVVSAVGSPLMTRVTVNFSEQVTATTATDIANYSISGGLTISSASLDVAGTSVVLTTSGQTTNTLYTVTVRNVRDPLGNLLSPSPATVEFRSFILARGGVLHKYWSANAGNSIAVLTSDPRFPDNPTFTTIEPAFEYPPNGGNEAGTDYGNQLIGFLHPPVTGDYVFYVSGDDPVELYLGTNEDPATKTLIASEPVWNNARQWLVTDRRDAVNPENRSTPIPLIAGRAYYIEALHTEGTGGDSVGATWQLPGASPPANGSPPISGQFLSTFVFPATDADLQITVQPQNTEAEQNRTATFTAAAVTTAPGTMVQYQWQKAPSGSSTFTNIPGANANSYTTGRLPLSESGVQFRVEVSIPSLAKQSSVATLTVRPDTTAPVPFKANDINASATTFALSFNELMDKTSAETATGYLFTPGNIRATSAALDVTGTNVTLTVAGQLSATVTNTLTFTGVKDLAGNDVSSTTALEFAFNRVTYAANIQFDGPLGYYRFEETSGSVATNSGTTGGDGVYYAGDEPSPGAGGTPTTPKGDPGPRPPEFAGFAVENRAATFTGFAANGGGEEWVDTKNKWLQNTRAFSLEYWVLTTDRANQGNRIAIVGQNDAVEYGFINPDTIEMWTDGGGEIETPYTFPDNEWHHIATIADGTSIKNYYDGVLVDTGGTPTSNYGSIATYNVKIGGGGVNDATGGFFNGRIDEVAIFDKAIPAERVIAHYRAGKEGGVLITHSRVRTAAGITLAISRSGANLTISWSPSGGTLQSTLALTGASPFWTEVGPANPATVTIGNATVFYRVAQ